MMTKETVEVVMRESLNAERNKLLEEGRQDDANGVAQLLFGDADVLVRLFNRIINSTASV